MQLLRRSCLWVSLVEGPLAVLVLAVAIANTQGWGPFLFSGLAAVVNLPGLAVARRLNLFAPGGGGLFEDGGKRRGVELFGYQAGADPIAGWIVTFIIGTLCWVALVWSIQVANRRR